MCPVRQRSVGQEAKLQPDAVSGSSDLIGFAKYLRTRKLASFRDGVGPCLRYKRTAPRFVGSLSARASNLSQSRAGSRVRFAAWPSGKLK